MTVNRMQAQVHEFLIKHLGAQADGWPNSVATEQSSGTFNKWLLIREEYAELTEALGIASVISLRPTEQTKEPDEAEVIKEACDLLYVIFNLFEELRVDAQMFFDRVHASNMSKTPASLTENRKITKGPDYVPPRIGELLALYRELQNDKDVYAHTNLPTCTSCNGKGRIRQLYQSHYEECGECLGSGKAFVEKP